MMLHEITMFLLNEMVLLLLNKIIVSTEMQAKICGFHYVKCA